VESTLVHWPDVDRKPNAFDLIKNKKIDWVINIPKNLSSEELNNDYTIRRAAVDFNIPLITNARLASAFIYAITKYKPEDLVIKAWNEY
jgi:carbamoyl-phosphate synthase large subunit